MFSIWYRTTCSKHHIHSEKQDSCIYRTSSAISTPHPSAPSRCFHQLLGLHQRTAVLSGGLRTDSPPVLLPGLWPSYPRKKGGQKNYQTLNWKQTWTIHENTSTYLSMEIHEHYYMNIHQNWIDDPQVLKRPLFGWKTSLPRSLGPITTEKLFLLSTSVTDIRTMKCATAPHPAS